MNSDDPKQSVIARIMDYYLNQPGGLDYAAYVPTQGDKLAEKQYWISWRPTSSHPTQMKDRLENFAMKDAAHDTRVQDAQIGLWNNVLASVHSMLKELDKEFVKTGQGENVRVVFDVDLGGFFYTRIGSHAVLFAATLDQAEVNNRKCENQMQRIVSEIEAFATAYGA